MKSENDLGTKVQSYFFALFGYLILLIQQIPGIWIWVPLMAAPLFLILGVLMLNLPASITELYQHFFCFEEVLIAKILILLSSVVIGYCVIYLGIKKRNGLVTTGPYRFIRHPQYTGILLLTIGFTAWSYYLITNSFGVGWISADQTILLWYLELFTYIGLALIEEKYLLRKFDAEYNEYRKVTPLLIPFIKAGKWDFVISLFIFSLVFSIAIQ
ncbi:MAG: methyltransferase family protein [Promethearchaeota archaeon]